MRLKFKQQPYQTTAAMAVVKCFEGQPKGIRKELLSRIIGKNGQYGRQVTVEEIFSNKKLELTEEDVLRNVQSLQKEHGLKITTSLAGAGYNFTIEMETGTGKTYVYTKTMYELNKQYGWSKFIIMVPSVAIREGVHKSLQITADHFNAIYGKKIRFSIYNTQNKSNLINIKQFARTSEIEVIIMNYQAFNVKEPEKALRSEAARKIYQELDALQSERPIDLIRKARPILIIDEPQRFGEKAENIFTKKEFDQLFTIRYSATHKNDFNKIYRLDAISAYNQKLVKKINVKGIEVVGNSGTNSYLFLDRIQISNNKYPTAYIELEVKQKTGIQKRILTFSEKDDLYVHSNELGQYKGFIIKEINGLTNKVIFTNSVEISVGQATGDVNEEHVRRIQIRETIKSHLEKERLMFKRGIKVLSLFFIDEVSKYRAYDKNGNPLKGDYARIFEEEYNLATTQPGLLDYEYNKYISSNTVEEIHKGYFSIDKKGNFVNSKEDKNEGGSNDETAYDLIMKNKEQLLSFSEPTRFIFSHSALREGWDNPNVFQICTLKHSQSNISKRQEIGRGLRICVDKNGERMDSEVLGSEFFDINKLTIIASESYDNFAKELQIEIFKSLSERAIILTTETLINTCLRNANGGELIFNAKNAMDLIFDFKTKGYIDENYRLTDLAMKDIANGKFDVPNSFAEFKVAVIDMVKSIYTTATFQAVENEKAMNINEAELKPNDRFSKKEFQDLWQKIKFKTVYEVNFNSDELIRKSIQSIDVNLNVKKIIVHITEGEQKDKLDETSLKKGTSMTYEKKHTEKTDSLLGSLKYDLVTEITKETSLTRKTVVRILKGIKEATFCQFQANPESFIRDVSRLINNEKATTLISNITYSKIDQCYEDSIFTINNFKGKLEQNILAVKKHVHDYLKTDSTTIENPFAKELETNDDVIVYAKLPAGPKGFQIPTPVGNYSPDWAIVFDSKKYKYVYFIAETKGTMETLELKGVEEKKIEYAKKHFEALGHADIKYDFVKTYEDLQNKIL